MPLTKSLNYFTIPVLVKTELKFWYSEHSFISKLIYILWILNKPNEYSLVFNLTTWIIVKNFGPESIDEKIVHFLVNASDRNNRGLR